MTSPLVPCEACSRHVRAVETACPFCDAPRTTSHGPIAPPFGRPLSRAAIVFATAAATTACGKTTTDVRPPPDPNPPVVVAAYAPAPPPDAAFVAPTPLPDAGKTTPKGP